MTREQEAEVRRLEARIARLEAQVARDEGRGGAFVASPARWKLEQYVARCDELRARGAISNRAYYALGRMALNEIVPLPPPGPQRVAALRAWAQTVSDAELLRGRNLGQGILREIRAWAETEPDWQQPL